jgi:hypothetical protein
MIKLDHSKLLGFKLEQIAAAAAKVGGKPTRSAKVGAKTGTKFGVKPPRAKVGAKVGGKPGLKLRAS